MRYKKYIFEKTEQGKYRSKSEMITILIPEGYELTRQRTVWLDEESA